MPLSFEEMAHWTLDDINAQILTTLPKDWTFEIQTHTDHWTATYKVKTEAGDENVVWTETHYALRVLLLSAFMWAHQKRNPTKVHPAWRRGPERALVPVHHSTAQHSIPDPQDLDPEHIRSVYAERARKMGKEND